MLDIWQHASTFPSSTLARVQRKLSDASNASTPQEQGQRDSATPGPEASTSKLVSTTPPGSPPPGVPSYLIHPGECSLPSPPLLPLATSSFIYASSPSRTFGRLALLLPRRLARRDKSAHRPSSRFRALAPTTRSSVLACARAYSRRDGFETGDTRTGSSSRTIHPSRGGMSSHPTRVAPSSSLPPPATARLIVRYAIGSSRLPLLV